MRALNTLKIVAVAMIAMATAIIAGCSGLPQQTDETVSWQNQKLYSEAQDALSSGDWSKCAKYFELLDGRDPFGRYAPQAQVNVAYCRWKDNETDAAEQAIERFIHQYPEHPEIAYAYYLKGLIHFNDDLGLFGRFAGQDMSERDPKALHEAYDAFRVVVERYPKSKYAPDAAQRMRYVVNALASHEVHAADYYYRRGAYIAAINRAQHVLKEYKNAPSTEQALHIIVRSYRELNLTAYADDAQRVLASTFPDSPYLSGRPRQEVNKKQPWWQIW